jgi:hypothetical protein
MFQRTDSSDLNSSGYNIVVVIVVLLVSIGVAARAVSGTRRLAAADRAHLRSPH